MTCGYCQVVDAPSVQKEPEWKVLRDVRRQTTLLSKFWGREGRWQCAGVRGREEAHGGNGRGRGEEVALHLRRHHRHGARHMAVQMGLTLRGTGEPYTPVTDVPTLIPGIVKRCAEGGVHWFAQGGARVRAPAVRQPALRLAQSFGCEDQQGASSLPESTARCVRGQRASFPPTCASPPQCASTCGRRRT